MAGTKSPKNNTVAMPKPMFTTVEEPIVLTSMVENIIKEHKKNPSITLALDLEGVCLGRGGDISIIQIYLPARNEVFLVDIFSLQDVAFSTTAHESTNTLKTILEDKTITKLVYDSRVDNEALFHLYGIKLAGIVDVQLVDTATRYDKRLKLPSLAMAIGRADMSADDRKQWTFVKTFGEEAMKRGMDKTHELIEETGGEPAKLKSKGKDATTIEGALDGLRLRTTDAFTFANQRPMPELVVQYCTNDVIVLPQLYKHLVEHRMWALEWEKRVEEATQRRLEQSRAADYDHNVCANSMPQGWEEIKREEKKQRAAETLAANRHEGVSG